MKKSALDGADLRILAAVQSHGQLSKTKLAELVNLSPTPCWERLTKLKLAGYITGYRGEIALNKLCDFTMVVVTVSLSHHRKSDFERFEAQVQAMDEIIDCVATGGGMDYVLKVVAPTLVAFQGVLDRLFAIDVDVDRYMTYIATRQIKSTVPNLSNLITR